MSFRLIRQIDIADAGITRRISLYHGDLTGVPAEHRADLLVVSAFPDDYLETSSSIIGALGRAGLSVGRLAADKAYDLRDTSAFWLSKPLGAIGVERGFDRLACFEPLIRGVPESVTGDLFRGLFPFLDLRNEAKVMMPILASGDQRRPPERMLTAILDGAIHWLQRGLPIRELAIVERSEQRLERLAEAWDAFEAQRQEGARPTGAESTAYDVFLSFSSEDGEAASELRRLFEQGTSPDRVFDFRLKIDTGSSWQRAIDEAISSSRIVVPLLTPDYFASPECREELMQARLRHKQSEAPVLFPIYWRTTGDEMALWLQVINLADCRESDYARLGAVVQQITPSA